jgi:hypothetical protein
VADGSVDAECQVLREGDAEWRWAPEVYPDLGEYSLSPNSSPSGAPAVNYQPLLTPKGPVSALGMMGVKG